MSNPCRLDDTTQNKIAYAMGYEKGKADAIDECIEIIKKCYTCEIIMKLEQLKEQNNDNTN